MKSKFWIILLIGGCISWAIQWPMIPQNQAQPLFKTYGDWNSDKVEDSVSLGYHSGVDIHADSLTPFYAVYGGVIADCEYRNDHNGYIGIREADTDTIAWWYGHVHLKLKAGGDSLRPGDTITVSESLGVVADFPPLPQGGYDHLHFDCCGCDQDSGWYEYIAYLDPLDSLSPSPSPQTPGIVARQVGIPHHPLNIYYVKDESEDTTNSYEATYLRDSIDILVMAYTDVQGIGLNGIYAIGYGQRA